MGAQTFEEYADGADVAVAFRDAHDRSCYEHGHGGYTGSLAEKGDYTVITNAPLLEEEAYALARQLTHDDDARVSDKWGPAGAIPVLRSGERATRTQTLTIKIPGGLDYPAREEAIRKEVAFGLKLKQGESLVAHTVRSETAGKARVQAVAPKGATETRYVITGGGQHGVWEKGLSSQAEARAKAVELAENPGRFNEGRDLTFEVQGVTRRVDGQPLVKVTRRIVNHTLEVEATIKLATSNRAPSPKPDGWLFFGWASS